MARAKLKIYCEQKYVSGRIRCFIKVWSRMLITGEVDYQKAINVYDRTEQRPDWKVKCLLKRKEVQNMLVEEIERLYEKNNVTPEFVIQKQLEILKLAMEKKDLTNAN